MFVQRYFYIPSGKRSYRSFTMIFNIYSFFCSGNNFLTGGNQFFCSKFDQGGTFQTLSIYDFFLHRRLRYSKKINKNRNYDFLMIPKKILNFHRIYILLVYDNLLFIPMSRFKKNVFLIIVIIPIIII